MFLLADLMRKGDFEGNDSSAIFCLPFVLLALHRSKVHIQPPKWKAARVKDENFPYGKFHLIRNGLPNVKTYVPLFFSSPVESSQGTSPHRSLLMSHLIAELGLKKKDSISSVFDADLVVWYPQMKFQSFKLTNKMLHHDIDYMPLSSRTG
jgi:dihydropyrimidinase